MNYCEIIILLFNVQLIFTWKAQIHNPENISKYTFVQKKKCNKMVKMNLHRQKEISERLNNDMDLDLKKDIVLWQNSDSILLII